MLFSQMPNLIDESERWGLFHMAIQK